MATSERKAVPTDQPLCFMPPQVEMFAPKLSQSTPEILWILKGTALILWRNSCELAMTRKISVSSNSPQRPRTLRELSSGILIAFEIIAFLLENKLDFPKSQGN